MIREYSPIDIGLDALGVNENENPATALGLAGKSASAAVRRVETRMNKALKNHPEMSSDILVASMSLMLDHVGSVEDVVSVVLPRLDRAVDRMAV